MLGYEWPLQFELDAAMDPIREIGFNTFAPWIHGLERSERAARSSLFRARDRERAIDAPPTQIGNDRSGRIHRYLSTVELIQAPALAA